MAEILFWSALGLLMYIYVLYPLLLWMGNRFFSRKVTPDSDFLPGVSLIVAAYNEEAVIGKKLENSLEIDYPADRLEIIVAADGCEDRTHEIVESFADRGVILNKVTPRGGKTRALNLTIPAAANDIIVLSDANAMYAPDSIRQLVAWLKDPAVGGVTGDVQILNEGEEFGDSEGMYYKYERFIQQCESDLGSIVGVDGAMYAFKRAYFRAPSNEIILDDFVTSMNIVNQGQRVLYNPRALAYENATPSVRQEFRRKARIAAGGMQALLKGEGLPGLTQLREWWMYLSHKLLRWFTSLFMLVALVSNFFLLGDPLWNTLFGIQMVFYSLSFFGMVFGKFDLPSLLKIPFYFCMVNTAILWGLFKGLLGLQKVTWKKADRDLVSVPPK